MTRSALITLFALTGCASTAPLPVRSQPISASLTTPCQPLPPMTKNSCEAAVETIIEVSEMYHECAARQADLARAERLRSK